MFGSTALAVRQPIGIADGDALRVTQWQYDPLRYGLAMFHSETTIVAISVVWSDVRIGLSAVWLGWSCSIGGSYTLRLTSG